MYQIADGILYFFGVDCMHVDCMRVDHTLTACPTQITNVPALRAAGIDPVLVARRATESLLLQLLQHGLYHSDPHPGNLAVTLGKGVRCGGDMYAFTAFTAFAAFMTQAGSLSSHTTILA